MFAGNAHPQLAQDISRYLHVPLTRALVSRFSDGEINVEILENIRGKQAFIIQPTCPPTSENFMELLVMVDAVKRASSARITAVVPYFGFARQDRRPRSSRVPRQARNRRLPLVACRTRCCASGSQTTRSIAGVSRPRA